MCCPALLMPGTAAALSATDCELAFWWSSAITTCKDYTNSYSVENNKCRIRATCRTDEWSSCGEWRDCDHLPEEYNSNNVLHNYLDVQNLRNCDGDLQLNSC